MAVGVRASMQALYSIEPPHNMAHSLTTGKNMDVLLFAVMSWISGPVVLSLMLFARLYKTWTFYDTDLYLAGFISDNAHSLYLGLVCLVTMGFIVSVTEVVSRWTILHFVEF